MGNDVWCDKHSVNPDNERWKVVMEEFTNAEDEGHREPFRGQVCPVCYMNLKSMIKDLKRNLKVESRENVSLRAENDRLQEVLGAVVQTVKGLTGKDAIKLASQTYVKQPGGCPGGMSEQGKLSNVLPNLIVEAVSQGVKKL